MNWNPITRIVGSLGIYTKIDFDKQGRRVLQHLFDLSRLQHFMKGKTRVMLTSSRAEFAAYAEQSRERSTYAQNMAFNVRHPRLPMDRQFSEAAEYMFDHNIFRIIWLAWDFCEQMIKETNPSMG